MTFLKLTRRVGQSFRFTGGPLRDAAILVTLESVAPIVPSDGLGNLRADIGSFADNLARTRSVACDTHKAIVTPGATWIPKLNNLFREFRLTRDAFRVIKTALSFHARMSVIAPPGVEVTYWDAEADREGEVMRSGGRFECDLNWFDTLIFSGLLLNSLTGEFSISVTEPGPEGRVEFAMELPREIDVLRTELGPYVPASARDGLEPRLAVS